MRLRKIDATELRIGIDVAFIKNGNGGPIATVTAFDEFVVRGVMGPSGDRVLFDLDSVVMYALEDES